MLVGLHFGHVGLLFALSADAMENHGGKRKFEETLSHPSVTSLSTDEIRQRLTERDAARSNKDWTTADGIKQQLRDLGIDVREAKGARGGTWSTKDGRCGTFESDMQTGFHFDSSLTTHKIQEMLDTRDQARKRKDWDVADKIKKELRANGVGVFDKDNVWTTQDGRQGHFGPGGFSQGSTDPMASAPWDAPVMKAPHIMAAPSGASPYIVTKWGDPLMGPGGGDMRGDMRGMRGDIFGDMRGDLRGYQGGGAPYQGGDMQYQGGGKGGDRHGDMLYQGGKGGKGGDIRGDMHYQGSGAPYLAGDMHYQGGGKGGDMRGDMRYQGDGKGGGDRRGDMHYQGGDMRGGMRGDMHGDMRGSMPGDMRMMEANFGPGAQYPQAGMQHQQKYMAPVERLAVERQMRQMPMQNARVTTQDAASLTALEISKLLSSRETCRGMRDWATADAIKQQLRGAGVHVDEVEKRWLTIRTSSM